jgi:hypothetical protein
MTMFRIQITRKHDVNVRPFLALIVPYLTALGATPRVQTTRLVAELADAPDGSGAVDYPEVVDELEIETTGNGGPAAAALDLLKLRRHLKKALRDAGMKGIDVGVFSLLSEASP